MKALRTKFKGTYIIKNNKLKDLRGFFMRGFCENILKKKALILKLNKQIFLTIKKNIL